MVRAKFRVIGVIPNEDGSATINLIPVVGGSPENDQFYKMTPGGNISLSTINKAAADQFTDGAEFYVDFTKSEMVPVQPDNTNTVAPPPTIGESRVRVKFNVVEREAERKNVDVIKYESAKLIDFCEDGKKDVDSKEWNDGAKSEAKRLWALAQTAYEEAAMYAVKAATYGL